MPIAGWLVAMVAATILLSKEKDLKLKILQKKCKNRKIILFSLLKNKKVKIRMKIILLVKCSYVIKSYYQISSGYMKEEEIMKLKSSGYSIGRSNDF